LITEAEGQRAFPSLTAQKTASFSLGFRPKSHDHPMNLPSDDPPEFWDSEALEKYIAKRKLEWLKEPDTSDDPYIR
jgi:hypothetical protein